MSVMIYEPRKFWMVSGDGPSHVRHRTQLEAEQEAQRLARLNPGQPFFVLEAIAAHRKTDVERRDLRADGPDTDEILPF